MGHLERQVHTKRQSLDSARDLKVQPGLRNSSPAEQKFDGKELNMASGAIEPKVVASLRGPNEGLQLGPPDQKRNP